MRVPKEHGAWAMLGVPFVLGVLVAGRAAASHAAALVLLLGVVIGLFLGRDSLLAWLRRRDRGEPAAADGRATLFQWGVAMVCGAALVVQRPPTQLLWLGVFGALVLSVHVVQMRRREARTVGGEILAILGLTSTAPAAYWVGSGAWSPRGLELWVVCILFFASSVFHVKLQLLTMQPKRLRQRQAMRLASAAYHLLLLAALAGLVLTHRAHPLLAVAFLPVIVRAFLALFRASGRTNLRRAGLLEIAYSLVFLVCTALAAPRTITP